MSYDLVCIGESLIDFISQQLDVEMSESDTYHALVGGSVTNVAITAGRLGAMTAMVGSIGDDPLGIRIKSELVAAGVHPYLDAHPTEATTAAVIMRSTGSPSFAILRGADVALSAIPEAMLDTRWVHTSAFALSHDPQRTTVVEFLQSVSQDPGVRTSLDVNYHPRVWSSDPQLLLPGLVALVDVVKVSADDCERLFGPGEASSHLVELFAWGAKSIVMTQGGDQALFATPQERVSIDIGERTVVDVTGAGDAFMAGFILATLDGLAVPEALAAGAEVAGRSVEVLGQIPEFLDRQELFGLAGQIG